MGRVDSRMGKQMNAVLRSWSFNPDSLIFSKSALLYDTLNIWPLQHTDIILFIFLLTYFVS